MNNKRPRRIPLVVAALIGGGVGFAFGVSQARPAVFAFTHVLIEGQKQPAMSDAIYYGASTAVVFGYAAVGSFVGSVIASVFFRNRK